MFDSKSFLLTLPAKPGVYKMLDAKNVIIYVGKAKNLKKRVSSYFQRNLSSTKTEKLVAEIADIETVVTSTETEALLLESNLIKQHRPRFNVLLRDDKSYPYLVFEEHEYPRMDMYRGPKRKHWQMFGPYPSVVALKYTLNLLQKVFKLRQCRNSFFRNRSRPCLQYQIKRCSAPCVELISKADYAEQVKNAVDILQGKDSEVIAKLQQQMDLASNQQNYESAAQIRDQISNLRTIQEQQTISVNTEKSTDVIAVAEAQGKISVALLNVRTGDVTGCKTYFPIYQPNTDLEEVLESFISQYYLGNHETALIPNTLVISHELSNIDWLEQALSNFAKHKVSVRCKVKNERAEWLKLANQNAIQHIESWLVEKANYAERALALREYLSLEGSIERIECFDISHTQGESTVAACVSYEQNGSNKNNYRRYSIKNISAGDDCAALIQALTRRYKNEALPDLVIIDGGKAQLKLCNEHLKELGFSEYTILSLCKGEGRRAENDQILGFKFGKIVKLNPPELARYLLQEIRDEAHRFAIMGHRKQQRKVRTNSLLQDIPGIGANKRQQLLRELGGMQQVKRASVGQLASVTGISKLLAQRIFDYLHEE